MATFATGMNEGGGVCRADSQKHIILLMQTKSGKKPNKQKFLLLKLFVKRKKCSDYRRKTKQKMTSTVPHAQRICSTIVTGQEHIKKQPDESANSRPPFRTFAQRGRAGTPNSWF